MGWSRTKYDRIGRVVKVAAFAGDGKPAGYARAGRRARSPTTR